MSFSVLGAYNEQDYNAPLYNDNDLYVSLTESVSSADARTYMDSLAKTDLVTLVENLIRYFNGQILSDIVSTPDNMVKTSIKTLSESVIPTDDTVTRTFMKNLVEILTPADVRTFFYYMQKVDAVNLVDALSKQITNKRVGDTVTLNDWFTIENNPQSDPWS